VLQSQRNRKEITTCAETDSVRNIENGNKGRIRTGLNKRDWMQRTIIKSSRSFDREAFCDYDDKTTLPSSVLLKRKRIADR